MGAMRYILGHLFHYMYVQAYTRYQYFNIIMTRTINQKYIASNYRFFFYLLFIFAPCRRARFYRFQKLHKLHYTNS